MERSTVLVLVEVHTLNSECHKAMRSGKILKLSWFWVKISGRAMHNDQCK